MRGFLTYGVSDSMVRIAPGGPTMPEPGAVAVEFGGRRGHAALEAYLSSAREPVAARQR
jgi:hypothetical protein